MFDLKCDIDSCEEEAKDIKTIVFYIRTVGEEYGSGQKHRADLCPKHFKDFEEALSNVGIPLN